MLIDPTGQYDKDDEELRRRIDEDLRSFETMPLGTQEPVAPNWEGWEANPDWDVGILPPTQPEEGTVNIWETIPDMPGGTQETDPRSTTTEQTQLDPTVVTADPNAGTPEGTQTVAPTAAPGAAPVPTIPTNPMSEPPPPPPPPTPGVNPAVAAGPGGAPTVGGTNIGDYASEWMSNPNRYLSPLVSAVRESGDLRREQMEREAGAGIDEWISQRGLVGSSYEGDARVDLQSQLAQNAAEEERQLLQMLADIEARDRLAAGEFGLDVAEFGQREDIVDKQLGTQLQLQGNELAQREAEFARNFGLDERRFTEQQNQFAQQYAEQVASRLQQNEQFYDALQSDEARFAMDAGLRERALDLQARGMDMDDAFRRAALEQERDLTMSAQELERMGMNLDDAYRYAALAQDSRFRDRALDLEERGMTLDEAFRYAELDQNERFRDRALDLEEQGLNMDEAYRYAVLDQDERFRQRALDLESRGMDLDEAYRQAELELREEGMDLDEAFRRAELDLREEGMDLDERFRRDELKYQNKESRARTANQERAILVQLLSALANSGGLGGDVSAIVDRILGGGGGGSTDTDFGINTGGVDSGSVGSTNPTPEPGDQTDMNRTYGPNNDMSYDEYVEWLARRGDDYAE